MIGFSLYNEFLAIVLLVIYCALQALSCSLLQAISYYFKLKRRIGLSIWYRDRDQYR